MLKRCSLVVLLVASAYAVSCGGGGGGSADIAGLSTPEQISIVAPSGGAALPPAGDPPADSAYATDQASVWVYDESIKPLGMVNEILCMLSQTGANLMVNQGPYKAQIDADSCQQGEDQGSSGTGQSSGANASTFEIWTIDSARESNSSPEIAHLWIPQTEGDGGSGPFTIFVNLQVDSGVDALRPFGEFTLNFAGALDDTGVLSPIEGGTLATIPGLSGASGFNLFHQQGDITVPQLPNEHAELTRATVQIGSDGLSGNARIGRGERSNFGVDSGIVLEEYLVAYDETELVRSLNGGPAEAFKRTEFNENVWRYNLYDATTGELVDLDSGFGFRTAAGEYGWMGYWGMWIQPGVSVANGDTVTKDVFGQAGVDYTVVRAPGKLIRETKSHIDLTALGGQTFQWFYFDPIAFTSTNYLVVYDTTAGEWQKAGIYAPGSSTVEPIEPPQAIDVAALGFLNMWSSGLGGQTAYVYGDTFLTYYVQEFVNGSDPVFAGGDLALFGLVQCLDSNISATDAETGLVNLPDATDVASPYTFEFHHGDLTLYRDTTGLGNLERVGLGDGQVPSTGPYTWGMRTGPLVTSTAGLTNPWDVWGADVFYVYETGANDWNQFTGLTDVNGDFVSFDPPISFRYVHAAANERNGSAALDGSTFFLQYGGAGQLWGLPQDGVDLNGDSQPDRWYPVVNLKDGTLLGPNGTEYLLRAMEVEQSLKPDPSYAGSLDLSTASTLVLPNSSIYTAPEIGPQPEVTDPPRVIEGEVVESGT